MNFYLEPGGKLVGRIRVPGDKSMSHRVIMLGSMVFTGAGACDARVPRISNSVPEGRHRRNLMAESARFPSAVSMVHRPSRDANEFGIPMPG